jgi:GNAT superfamily N-acetyltransferase
MARGSAAFEAAHGTVRPLAIRCLPATPARWRDVERLFSPRGACAGCWCMWPRLTGAEFRRERGAGNKRSLRRLVAQGEAPGMIAYRGGVPVGWCGMAPREQYQRLERSRVMARVDDQPVWSVVCFFVDRAARRSGVTTALLRAAVAHAAKRGARIIEGYPLDAGGKQLADTFAWFGLASAFESAGFKEVARRSATRPVMRYRVRGRASGAPPAKAPRAHPRVGARG